MLCATNQETWPSASSFAVPSALLLSRMFSSDRPQSAWLPQSIRPCSSSVLVRPYHSLPQRSAVSECEYADIEGVNELQASSCQSRAVLHHILHLAPFLEPLDGYKLGRDDGFKEQGDLV
jgi:hypothetical protein